MAPAAPRSPPADLGPVVARCSGELKATAELVFPIGLASLLARLFRGERPQPPVELPWRPASEIAP